MGLRADSPRPRRVSGSARTDSRRAESARNPIAVHVKVGDDSALNALTRTQWTAAFTVSHGARRLRPRRTSLVAKRAGYLSPPRVALLQSPAAQCGPGRRGRPNALASVGLVPVEKLAPPLSHVVWLHWSVPRGVSIARRTAALVVLATQRR